MGFGEENCSGNQVSSLFVCGPVLLFSVGACAINNLEEKYIVER